MEPFTTPTPHGGRFYFKANTPTGSTSYRTGEGGAGLWMWDPSHLHPSPHEGGWAQVLGTSQFHLTGSMRQDSQALMHLKRDLEVRDVARTHGMDARAAASEIGCRFIGY